ncbi:MAG: alpha/beta hydrolase [Caldilineaceae bacterium]|nr:alpha/beta hydrolase [Caldilineaceae bacterium]
MNKDRIQRTLSADGTQIAARVYGQGLPLILLSAGPGDSETSWEVLLPFLSERFTCYLLNTRGRGLSADHPDHSPQRLVEDVVAFADALGEPVGLVGWGSTLWALVAAEHTATISAVAAYEPGANEVMSEEVATCLSEAFIRMGELVAEGRLLDAARVFIEKSNVIYTPEELAGGTPQEFWEAAAPNIPDFLHEEQQMAESGQPGPTDPAVLTKITVPVLLLRGSESKPWFVDSLRHVADHLPNSHQREIVGAGHFGLHTEPEAVADELTRFFTSVQQPA